MHGLVVFVTLITNLDTFTPTFLSFDRPAVYQPDHEKLQFISRNCRRLAELDQIDQKPAHHVRHTRDVIADILRSTTNAHVYYGL